MTKTLHQKTPIESAAAADDNPLNCEPGQGLPASAATSDPAAVMAVEKAAPDAHPTVVEGGDHARARRAPRQTLMEDGTMPREDDIEGAQDQAGRHGGLKGVPKPEPRPDPVDEDDGDICSPRVEPSTDDDRPLP